MAPSKSKKVLPQIDPKRCEAKQDCVPACPYDVLQIQRIPEQTFDALSWLYKAKSIVHGRRIAVVADPDKCDACGACVSACPERAIRLVRAPGHDAA